MHTVRVIRLLTTNLSSAYILFLLAGFAPVLQANSITEKFSTSFKLEESGVAIAQGSTYEKQLKIIKAIKEYPSAVGKLTQAKVSINFIVEAQGTVSTQLTTSGTVFSASLTTSANLLNYGNGDDISSTSSWTWDCECDPVETDGGTVGMGSATTIVKDSTITGGAVPITANLTLSSPNGSISGFGWRVSGTMTVEYTYETKSKEEIVVELLKKHRDSNKNPSEVADLCWDEIITLREFGAATSGGHIELRDAEYLCRGLAGGYANQFDEPIEFSDLINEAGNRIPWSIYVYNSIKKFKGYFGWNISGSDELPATPAGGEDAFLIGYKFADEQKDIDEVIEELEGGLPPKQAPCLPDSDCVTMPDLAHLTQIDQDLIQVAVFDIAAVEPDQDYVFDPVLTQGYIYLTPNNRMTRVTLPESMAAHITNVMLVIDEVSHELDAGQPFDLTSVAAGGIREFLLIGDVEEGSADVELLLEIAFKESASGVLLILSNDLRSNIAINAGHAGAWYNPETPGQGGLIDISPDNQFLFLSWFTCTEGVSSESDEQHWFTGQGNYSGNTAVLVLYESTGGKFDDPHAVSTNPIGTVILEFSDCKRGLMKYTLDNWGREGSFPLERAIPGSENICEQLSNNPEDTMTPQAVNINAGMDGAWYNPATAGQGLLVDAFPNPNSTDFIFMAWFTYGDETASGLRWLTAQGSYEGSIANVDVFETTNGRFDDPQGTETVNVGTAIIDFTDCNNAQMSYSLTAEGKEGEISLTRALPGGDALCKTLGGAE